MVNCNLRRVHRPRHRRPAVLRAADLEDVEVYYAEQASGPRPGRGRGDRVLSGQTLLGLAERLRSAGCRSWAPARAIDPAEDRGDPVRCRRSAGLPAPRFGTATSFEQARRIAADIGHPVLVRLSYVLGGAA